MPNALNLYQLYHAFVSIYGCLTTNAETRQVEGSAARKMKPLYFFKAICH